MSHRRLAYALAGLAALTACTDVPGGTARVEAASLDEAVATLGCTMVTEADYGAVEFQANLTRDEVKTILGHKLARGEAERLDNGGIRLTSGACAA